MKGITRDASLEIKDSRYFSMALPTLDLGWVSLHRCRNMTRIYEVARRLNEVVCGR